MFFIIYDVFDSVFWDAFDRCQIILTPKTPNQIKSCFSLDIRYLPAPVQCV